jgi:hypothetical protein
MTREEAIESVARDVLADPDLTMKVVIAAIIAQDRLPNDHPARVVLDHALEGARI